MRRTRAARVHHAGERPLSEVRARLWFAGFSVLAVTLGGSLGYYALGEGRWAYLDCLYMVLVTITTVGFGEVLPVGEVPGGRLFTLGLLGFGVSVSVYFMSTLTAFIVEGDLGEAIWRRKMERNLDKLSGHYIVCGAGVTGRSVVEELLDADQTLVAVEIDPEHLETLARQVEAQREAGHGTKGRLITLCGDATEDAVLLEAGLERASGVVATLENDRDNLFVVVTAKQVRPDGLRIISRTFNESSGRKLVGAGADSVVSPNMIGGRRMAHELLRPSVAGFMELMSREREQQLRVEEIPIPTGSPLASKTLAKSGIRKGTNALVLSIQEPDGTQRFNPSPDQDLAAGMTLVVMGDPDALAALKALVHG